MFGEVKTEVCHCQRFKYASFKYCRAFILKWTGASSYINLRKVSVCIFHLDGRNSESIKRSLRILIFTFRDNCRLRWTSAKICGYYDNYRLSGKMVSSASKTQNFSQSFPESSEKMQDLAENLAVKKFGLRLCERDIKVVL